MEVEDMLEEKYRESQPSKNFKRPPYQENNSNENNNFIKPMTN